MIAVADKRDNVFIGTDRHRPSRWPIALLDYLRGPGHTKVLFGTDFPVVPYDVAARRAGRARPGRRDAARPAGRQRPADLPAPLSGLSGPQ